MLKFNKFLEEQKQLDEMHDRYMRSHGKKASGRGRWMFTTRRMGDVDHKDMYHHDKEDTVSKAAAAARKYFGTKDVYVMEEVEQVDEARLDEISPKLARKAAATSQAKSFEYGSSAYGPGADKETDRLSKKADKAMAHVQKRQGDKGVRKVGRLANKAIFGKSRAFESTELEEGRSEALKALEGLAKKGGMDKADFQKAHDLYKANKLQDLRKHIYRLDTSPSEAVVEIIDRHDSKAFNSMYPRAKSGDYLRKIVLDHGGK